MLRDRWQQLITIAVIVTLVLAVVGVGLGIDALHKSKTKTTTPKGPSPVTSIFEPRTGQLLSGKAELDVVAISTSVMAVDILATGGSLHDAKIATAAPSLIGWITQWSTTSVPNGTYQLVSVGYSHTGRSVRSPVVIVKVVNF